MHQILNTLYVTTPNSYVHLENDTLRVEVERETKLRVPLHHLGAVVCFGNVLVSSAALCRCADDGIGLVFLNHNGRFKARLEGPVSGNILLRRAQHQQVDAPVFALETARAIIAGKIRNSRHVLLRGARDAHEDKDAQALRGAAEHLVASLRAAAAVLDLDALRGVEGDAAKTYFEAMPTMVRRDVRPVFAMNGRTRRPPRDRFNALISFLYSMLMNDCRSALEAVGLDPQLGFLHALRPGRAALALDLMEEFRSVVADRLALTLINRGQIGENDFSEREGGAVLLEDDARKTAIVAYQERKQEEISHPLLQGKMPIGLVPMLQARLLARTLRGEMDGYLPFTAQ